MSTKTREESVGARSTDLQVRTTEDGSPTLADSGPYAGGTGEWMHHSGGALSESAYVYEPAVLASIAWATHASSGVKQSRSLHLACIGLGLGYLEMLVAGHLVKAGNRALAVSCRISSYEANPVLREQFQSWLSGRNDLPQAQACAHIAAHLQIDSERIRKELQNHSEAETLKLNHSFSWSPERSAWNSPPLNAILFDAYSPHSSPDLWNEDALTDFLKNASSPAFCVFASYASRISLKRSLKSAGYTLLPRKGFLGKRECTFAQKSIHFNWQI